MRYILASQSPRRKELLEKAGISFDVFVPNVDETILEETPPEKAVIEISLRKAKAVREKIQDMDSVIISADTVVAIDGKILGKPNAPEDAERMLSLLSGSVHQVYTGVTIAKGNEFSSFYSVSSVEFYPLSKEEIKEYVATGEPMDKAGAYGIQGRGCVLVKRIEGDYYNIMGLPIAETVRRIKD